MQFIDFPLMCRLVKDVGIERFLLGLTGYLERDFRRWLLFESSVRLAAHSQSGEIELMPTNDGSLYSFKYVNGHPENVPSGKLAVAAFGVLADCATGYPLLLCEMTLLTALRTAATSALAVKYLARRSSCTLGLIGAGAQAEFHALAFKAVNGVARVRCYDVDAAAMSGLVRNLRAFGGFELELATSIVAAVDGMDIVSVATAAGARAPVIDSPMICHGTHINAVGGDCAGKTDLVPEIFRRARVFVEDAPQTRIDGEIQDFGTEFPVTELWKVILGMRPGRISDSDITLFDSVGVAIEDFAALRYVRDLLEERGWQACAPLIPALAGPKNLFGPLRRHWERQDEPNQTTR